MEHRELQNKLNEQTRKLSPEEVLSKFQAAGWHSRKFIHMGVIALHPVYDDYSLGTSDYWLYGHRTPIRDIQAGESWLLWVYPDESVLEVLK